MENAQNFAAVVSSLVLGLLFFDILTQYRIFQNMTDSMSSGMENAQNFAAIISSMVLGPSFLDYFSMLSYFLVVVHVFSIFLGGPNMSFL